MSNYLQFVFLALSPWETIGFVGVHNFMLCKNPQVEKFVDSENLPSMSP